MATLVAPRLSARVGRTRVTVSVAVSAALYTLFETESVADTGITGLVEVETALVVPDAVRVAAPQLAKIPAGSPVTLKLAVLAARVTPPTGVAVTVITWVAIDNMLIEAGERATLTAGAAVTCTEAVAEAVCPSPVA